MSTTQNAIEVRNLQKSYGDLEVLRDVNFTLPKGDILALLGPNGAGKTTAVNVLSTLLKKDGGEVLVNGFNVETEGDQVRAQIGLTGQFAAVDEYLTGRENIELIGGLYHMKRSSIKPLAQKLLERFDLVEAGDRPARTYSGGMKRRLDLAMSLVANPPIIFLDEPTTGLDPRSRNSLWDMVKGLSDEGVSILLTTQYMEEAEYLADNVIVLDQGTIIAEGTVNQLKAKGGSERIEVTLKNEEDVPAAAKLLSRKPIINDATQTITFPAKKGVESLQEALDKLKKAKLEVDTAGVRRPTLDDVFLAITGHKAEDQTADKKTKKGAK